ncbi:MAG: 2TM domain-containing protein [Bacteroidota bacterium]
MSDSKYYERAKEKVAEKKKFHNHLRSYIVVNLIMLFSGVFFRSRGGWAMVALFWGIGLFSHYVKAYGFMGLGDDRDWEDKEIEKEMRRMRTRDQQRNRTAPHDAYDQEEEIDMDDYLDLDQPQPMPRKKYDEDDLV